MIDPGVLSNDLDAAMMVQALKAAIEFLAAPAFEGYVISPAQDLESAVGSDEGLLEYIKQHASTVNHPVSTSSMSPKGADYGVTDPDLKLKKVEGVRIVDASVFVRLLCLPCSDIALLTICALPAVHSCWPHGLTDLRCR